MKPDAHDDGHAPVIRVFRKTELSGTGPARTAEEVRVLRKKTQRKIRSPDAEVPYRTFDSAFRDLVCSLIERQDRARDEFFFHVADLQQQLDDLERRFAGQAQEKPGTAEARS